MMPKRLVVAGIVIMGIGLALLGYLDPVIRIIFFGPTGAGLSGGTSFTRTGSAFTFSGSTFTGGGGGLGRGAAAGTTSLVSVVTIIVFVATVVGLLLTIAGSFATGRPMPTGAGPGPAAEQTSSVSSAEPDQLARL